MKRFEFKLQAVLSYRRHLERIAQQEVARAMMDVKECEKQIIGFKTAQKESALALEKLIEKGVTAKEFQYHYGYIESVKLMVRDEKQRKLQLEKKLNEKIAALKKRTIDKKAMERLRERRAGEYNLELLRMEQKELDEISSLKTARELANAVE